MALQDWEKLPRKSLTKSENPVARLMLTLLERNGRAKIRYTVRGKTSERWIKPTSLFTVNNLNWPGEYIEAHCELRSESRVFEINNITVLEPGPNIDAVKIERQSVPSGRIECSVDYATLDGNYGDVEGIQVTCPRCGHATESFGTSAASVRRCMALLREECPRGETNFYVED